jgi:hypothetical protein
MPPVRPLIIPGLRLRRASESRAPEQGPDDYDVINNDGEVVGSIVRMFRTSGRNAMDMVTGQGLPRGSHIAERS